MTLILPNTGALWIGWGDSLATLGTTQDRRLDMHLGDKWFITARWINVTVKRNGMAQADATIEYCVIATAG